MRPSDHSPTSRGAAHEAIALALLVVAIVGGAGVARAEPDTAAGGVVYERPPAGPRRGVFPVPAAVVYGTASFALLGATAYMIARVRDARRR